MSMTTEQIASAVEAWAASVLPTLHTYEHAPRSLAQAMPLALAEVQRKQHQELNVTESNFQQYQF